MLVAALRVDLGVQPSELLQLLRDGETLKESDVVVHAVGDMSSGISLQAIRILTVYKFEASLMNTGTCMEGTCMEATGTVFNAFVTPTLAPQQVHRIKFRVDRKG